MKIIFLDFNGILDTWENFDVIDESNLKRLQRIVVETEAKVVITSSCKNNYNRTGVMGPILKMLVETLLVSGIDVVGIVPNSSTREEEIAMYLEVHPEIENFVILDDDYDMLRFKDNLIKLPSQSVGIGQNGLEDKHVDDAIRILGKSLNNDNKRRLL